MQILIPVDFSEASAHMLRFAFDLNRYFFAKLQILHLFDVPITAGDDSEFYLRNYEAYRKSYEDELWAFVKKNKGQFHYDTEVFASSGGHYQGIVSFAKSHRPDLVIIGHKGTGGLKRWMLGSVSRYLLTHPPVPVLSIPETYGFSNGKAFKNILLATDLSSAIPEEYCRFLKDFSERMEAEITILHCTVSGEISLPEEEKVRALLQQSFSKDIRMIPLQPGEHVTTAITQYIEDNAIDLLVTLPHEHTWIDKWLIGSETRELASKVKIPLMSFPEKYLL
jgi:nucleotide-binding universal stress UspA family protein